MPPRPPWGGVDTARTKPYETGRAGMSIRRPRRAWGRSKV